MVGLINRLSKAGLVQPTHNCRSPKSGIVNAGSNYSYDFYVQSRLSVSGSDVDTGGADRRRLGYDDRL